MKTIIHIENLKKSFEGITALNGVQLTMANSESILISGGNGSGKSTLVNLITGVDKPNSGSIQFEGVELTKLSIQEIAQLGIIRMYQQPRVFRNMTVIDNLAIASKSLVPINLFNQVFRWKTLSIQQKEQIKQANELLEKFKLSEFKDRVVGELSYGQQKIVSFCMLSLRSPKLMILDEPFAGLNPQTIDRFINMIQTMQNQGVFFIIIEHNITKAKTVCSTFYQIDNGILSPIIHPKSLN